MTEIKVREVLSMLKIKNCEGTDRIPLQILNEGAKILTKPLSGLFKLKSMTNQSYLSYKLKCKEIFLKI